MCRILNIFLIVDIVGALTYQPYSKAKTRLKAGSRR